MKGEDIDRTEILMKLIFNTIIDAQVVSRNYKLAELMTALDQVKLYFLEDYAKNHIGAEISLREALTEQAEILIKALIRKGFDVDAKQEALK